nr:hypothetical protein [Aureimonas sp. AU4]
MVLAVVAKPAEEVIRIVGEGTHARGAGVEEKVGMIGRVGDAGANLGTALDDRYGNLIRIKPKELRCQQDAARAPADDQDPSGQHLVRRRRAMPREPQQSPCPTSAYALAHQFGTDPPYLSMKKIDCRACSSLHCPVCGCVLMARVMCRQYLPVLAQGRCQDHAISASFSRRERADHACRVAEHPLRLAPNETRRTI